MGAVWEQYGGIMGTDIAFIFMTCGCDVCASKIPALNITLLIPV